MPKPNLEVKPKSDNVKIDKLGANRQVTKPVQEKKATNNVTYEYTDSGTGTRRDVEEINYDN